jgi:pyridoxal phosphate enzyme (YggS family)
MNIGSNIDYLKAALPRHVKIVAVSKFHPAEAVWEAYNAGQRLFGESRAQEITAKQKVLPADIEWHFIGPLQSNKVKDIAPFVHTIQSVDSLKLLQEIDKQAAKQGRIIRVLLEIHIGKEENKHGFTAEECKALCAGEATGNYPHILLCGLMGIATFTENEDEIRKEFHSLRKLFDELKSSTFKDCDYFSELSMGMSGDYLIAISEGSTMVRIGSYIFGNRT